MITFGWAIIGKQGNILRDCLGPNKQYSSKFFIYPTRYQARRVADKLYDENLRVVKVKIQLTKLETKPERNTMTETQLKHIAKIIEKELGFTNGWSIADEEYAKHCLGAAKKIKAYMFRQVVKKHKLKLEFTK